MTTITQDQFNIQAGNLRFTFWPSGDLFQAVSGNTMINQLISNPLDGSLNNLYLRVHDESGIRHFPLLGIHSASTVSHGDNMIQWTGKVQGIKYTVKFTVTSGDIWFWDVLAEGHGAVIDLIYGQDIGIADIGAVRSNEAYLSQYIDHRAFQDQELGYVVCSRQNQPQGGSFPYLQQGAITGTTGYTTDGFQFFGLSYKEANTPACLSEEQLASEVYQYEFAYTGLQSEKVELNGEARFVFYGLFKGDHPAALTELEYLEEAKQAWKDYESQASSANLSPLPPVRLNPVIGDPLQGHELTEEEINVRFPAADRHQEERKDGSLLAFFTPTYEHIVLKSKEMLVERPHGHILMNGNNVEFGAKVIATTSFMYGIFNSHVVVGNTNMNKMMSNARNALNIPKTSGQRIYIEKDGAYHVLTMPSMFEIGLNYVRWYYKMDDDMLIITNFSAVDTPEVRLHVQSEQGHAYHFMVTSQVTMNVNEYTTPVHMTEESGVLTFHGDTNPDTAKAYPDLKYRMWVDGAKVRLGDETMLAEGVAAGSASLVTMKLEQTSDWTLTIQGLLDGEQIAAREVQAEEEIIRYREFYSQVMNGFHLSNPKNEEGELFKVNALAWWYTHNMFVHYSSPHGLEQYGGAAWGTRDVCQGPVEYFMATQKYDQVKDILRMVYSHQYEDDGNWPQWFMFDQYFAVQQEESHGDIIVWPLKVLSDYLTVTRDYSILEEKVPYTMKHSFQFTENKASILEHAQKEIQYIREHFLHDTHLSSYGDGDWDDTLQPANAQLKQFMASSWTVALTYQTIGQLSSALRLYDSLLSDKLSEMAANIRQDFKRYMLNNDVIPGFLYLEDPKNPKLMLHPEDKETGIQYRLLPMTRSMISELLSPEEAKAHYDLIQKTFLFPDGVRLMNRPASYEGGISKHFKRAEQASNFGREVGLQYVHAHIRYIEAMAKLGHADDVWKGLETINPVGIQEVVPNAALRQSNSYFSSSDGSFKTRYDAQENFEGLRIGDVQVKGGWRIYSSGPGIYMNQLISSALGIRQVEGDLVLDPVIPASMDGLQFEYGFAGSKVTFIYHITGVPIHRVVMNGHELESLRMPNPYREGGIRVSRHDFERMIQDRNVVEIFM
ncbi:GH36-type glycosyl hydrolase domain-containing protein [Paenibacillus dakarensis]|uniref:GH36-type glycosyl hydrolase domain-containing protein n=1 Tax=Paenibacillus dakarensis TaxID=1527293 RepID=UPI0006D573A1|nr:cellobiose phosphorylase [Paenibacillus dakarensis]